jgi:pectin methylesterase-like acyl-CoA thioesterase
MTRNKLLSWVLFKPINTCTANDKGRSGIARSIFIYFLYSILLWLIFPSFASAQEYSISSESFIRFPADKAINVNPDTHLEITFRSVPILGKSGEVRIYDAANNRLVDLLDLSIPAGPTARTLSPSATYSPIPYEYVTGHFTNANTKPGNPSGVALPTPFNYQLTIIGGFTDGFHFYPVIIHDSTASIYLHNNLLEYGKTYYVQIDPGVLTLNDNSFTGIKGNNEWTFTTKNLPPSVDSEWLVVTADGSGDFNTVQGAIDFIPDFNPKKVTIFIKNGSYEEIVYFRNKSNINILGEDRDKVVVFYANSEVFNPHPLTVLTNEVPGTFPSRRAAFAVDNSCKINLINLTIETTVYGQAEGLLVNGKEIIVNNVKIIGSGDALQSNGSVYYTDSHIIGAGDVILGRGPAFFNNCEINSNGPYMWIRNTSANHGNVFVNCKFITPGTGETIIARAPTNGGRNYPYCESVLINCALSGISPVGWGAIGGETSNVHYWEYNSTNISDGKPVDVSQRHPASRQLTMKNDAGIIANYMNPAYVFDGWNPTMAPLILKQPEEITVKTGMTATFSVKVAAIPVASYQWFKNDVPLKGATNATITLKKISTRDAGTYSVSIKNDSGVVTSQKAKLNVK